MRLILPILLLSVSVSHAQSLKLPALISAAPGRLAPVRVEITDGDDIAWVASEGLDVFREYSTDPKDVRLRVQGFALGKYQLVAVTCKGGKLSPFGVCVVSIDGVSPVPPAPKPPEPIPVPPTPVPPAPLPDTPAAERIRKAWSVDEGERSQRVVDARTASAFYSAMAAHAKDPEVKTVGDLLSDYQRAIGMSLKPRALIGTRKAIGSEIAALVGDDPSRNLDPELRDKIILLLEFIAKILAILA